jgi:hypothetical protein
MTTATRRIRRLSLLWLCSLSWLAVARGSAKPQSRSSADEESFEEQSEPEETSLAPEERERAGQCYEKCQQYINAAAKLLAQAGALKGAEQAQLALYSRATDAYIRAWRGCDLVLPDGEDLGCESARDVVPGMVQAMAGTNRPEWLVFAYLVALDDRWRDDSSELAARAPVELRDAAEAAAKEAQRNPKGEHAIEASAAAVYAELALEEVTQASRHAAEHARAFARSAPDSVSLVAAAVAAYYNDREQWSEALTALSGPTNPAPAKHPATKILWHSERGRALAGLGRKPAAAQAFGAALQAWRPPDPNDPSKVVGRQQPAPMLGRERVMDAVGAAYFYLGEQKREQAAGLAPPRYQGPQTPEGVERFIQGPLARWAQQRQKLVAAANASYRHVYELRPVPPPRWVVAAQAQTGAMWDRFAQDMVSLKLPPKLAGDTETREAFERALQGSAKPAKDAALKAYETCRKLAKQYKLDSEYSARCLSGQEE